MQEHENLIKSINDTEKDKKNYIRIAPLVQQTHSQELRKWNVKEVQPVISKPSHWMIAYHFLL